MEDDVGCRMQDAGCRMQDERCWMTDVGCSHKVAMLPKTPVSYILHLPSSFLFFRRLHDHEFRDDFSLIVSAAGDALVVIIAVGNSRIEQALDGEIAPQQGIQSLNRHARCQRRRGAAQFSALQYERSRLVAG